MPSVIYKKIGKNEFAYCVTSKRNPQKKQSRRKKEYPGKVIDKANQQFENVRSKQYEEQLIPDFGDGYVLDHCLKTSIIFPLLDIFPAVSRETLCALLFYRICYSGAMMHAKN